jgi:hypothetical protein
VKSLTVKIERGENGEIWGSVEHKLFLHTTVGKSISEINQNLIDLIKDDFEHGEYDSSPTLKKFVSNGIVFDYEYFLTDIFKQFKFLKINDVAKEATINPTLLHQYACGAKSASANQASKITNAIHNMAKQMLAVSVIA